MQSSRTPCIKGLPYYQADRFKLNNSFIQSSILEIVKIEKSCSIFLLCPICILTDPPVSVQIMRQFLMEILKAR